MTIAEVYAYYITPKKAAEAAGVSREAFYKWVKRGHIPYLRQCKYEKLTKGKLKASEDSIVQSSIMYPSYRFWHDKYGMRNVISLTFSKSSNIRIKVELPKPQFPVISFETHRLMQCAYIKDSKGILLFEKDIVIVNKRKKTLETIFDNDLLLQELKSNKFTIIGNVFEGGKND